MQKYIIIVGDTNDADYITAINKINDEQIKEIQPVMNAICAFKKKNAYGHSWPASEYSNGSPQDIYKDLTDEQTENFNENYIPWGNGGIHSIKSIKIWDVAAEEQVL